MRKRWVSREETLEQMINDLQSPQRRQKQREKIHIPALKLPSISLKRHRKIEKIDNSMTKNREEAAETEENSSKDQVQFESFDGKYSWELGDVETPLVPQERYSRVLVQEGRRPAVRVISPEEQDRMLEKMRHYRLNLHLYTPSARLHSLHQRSTRTSTRLSINKATHTEIHLSRIRHFQQILDLKQRKFQWRQIPLEIQRGKMIWTGILVGISGALRWKCRFRNRKVGNM